MNLAARAIELLLSLSLLIQTLEYLRLRGELAPGGAWPWAVQREDIPSVAIRRLLDRLFAPRAMSAHLYLRLPLVVLLAVVGSHPALSSLLLVSHLLILVRWRGAFNGGSDFMTLVVLTGLFLGDMIAWAGHAALGWQVCVWYITVQVVTSYFVAGWVKLLRREWRNGSALRIFLQEAVHGPLPDAHPLRQRGGAMLASWAFILWECSFPLALLDVRLATVYCTIAVVFHGLVFWFFGLNRFFWAWLAALPAVVWCAAALSVRIATA